MPRLTVSLIALTLAASATAASASDVNSAAAFGASAYANAVSIYPRTREEERKWLIQRLEAVCSSQLRSDQRRCDRAFIALRRAHTVDRLLPSAALGRGAFACIAVALQRFPLTLHAGQFGPGFGEVRGCLVPLCL